MKTIYCLFFIIILLPTSFCFGQKTKEYFDKDWSITSEENAAYYRIGSKDASAKYYSPIITKHIYSKLLIFNNQEKINLGK